MPLKVKRKEIMDFMLSFRLLVVAQAGSAPGSLAEQATVGQTLSIMLVMLTMAASLVMIVAWVVRLGQTGHSLPAARRGILRVPMPLTVVAVGLSLLMVSLTMLNSANETGGQTPEPDVQNPESLPVAESAPVAETPPVAETTAEPAMTPAQMLEALVSTAVVDLILLAVLGIVVLVSRNSGRVRLSDRGNAVQSVEREFSLLAATTFSSTSFWPDLNDTSAIPELPGYAVLGNRTALQPPVLVAQESPYAPPQLAESMDEHALPDERFSLFTELRYAGEVFLAAYLPTAFLRIMVVIISESIYGKPPGQHPFLDMLDSGVGINIMALILLTAVFMAPIVEELQFRVVILGGLAQLGRPGLAFGLSSLLFAFAHGFPDSLALLPLAAALAYAYLRRRSYVTVMLVHFFFNAFNMAIALIAML